MAQRFIDVKLIGSRKLQKKLNKLRIVDQKRAVKAAMKKAMEPVQAAAISKAPKGETGATHKNIKIGVYRGKWSVGAVVRTGTRKQLKIPDSAKFYYPAAHEYGWRTRSGRQMPARSFMRAALKEQRRKAINIFRRELASIIKTIR